MFQRRRRRNRVSRARRRQGVNDGHLIAFVLFELFTRMLRFMSFKGLRLLLSVLPRLTRDDRHVNSTFQLTLRRRVALAVVALRSAMLVVGQRIISRLLRFSEAPLNTMSERDLSVIRIRQVTVNVFRRSQRGRVSFTVFTWERTVNYQAGQVDRLLANSAWARAFFLQMRQLPCQGLISPTITRFRRRIILTNSFLYALYRDRRHVSVVTGGPSFGYDVEREERDGRD